MKKGKNRCDGDSCSDPELASGLQCREKHVERLVFLNAFVFLLISLYCTRWFGRVSRFADRTGYKLRGLQCRENLNRLAVG